MIYIVTYEHGHGTDVWPMVGDVRPSLEGIVSDMIEWEPEKERLSITGPWTDEGGDCDLYATDIIGEGTF